MKHHSHIGSFLMAVAALLASGCFTGDGYRTPVHHEATDDLDSSIDTIVNDKSTWVDPVSPGIRP